MEYKFTLWIIYSGLLSILTLGLQEIGLIHVYIERWSDFPVLFFCPFIALVFVFLTWFYIDDNSPRQRKK